MNYNTQKLSNPFLKSSPFNAFNQNQSQINHLHPTSASNNMIQTSTYASNYGLNKQVPTHDNYISRNLNPMPDEYKSRTYSRHQNFNRGDLGISTLLDNNPFRKSTVRAVQPSDQYLTNNLAYNNTYRQTNDDNYNPNGYNNKYSTNYDYSSTQSNDNKYKINTSNNYDKKYDSMNESNYNSNYDNKYNNVNESKFNNSYKNDKSYQYKQGLYKYTNMGLDQQSSTSTPINIIQDDQLKTDFQKQEIKTKNIGNNPFNKKLSLGNSISFKNQKDQNISQKNHQLNKYNHNNGINIDQRNTHGKNILKTNSYKEEIDFNQFDSVQFDRKKSSKAGESIQSVDDFVQQLDRSPTLNPYQSTTLNRKLQPFATQLGKDESYQNEDKKNVFHYNQNNLTRSFESKNQDFHKLKHLNQHIVQFEDYQEDQQDNHKNYNQNYCPASKQNTKSTQIPKVIQVQGMLYHLLNTN